MTGEGCAKLTYAVMDFLTQTRKHDVPEPEPEPVFDEDVRE